MLDKFTERALKSVISSQQEAKDLGHSRIGTEHLLLGLMSAGTGIQVRVLKAVGVTAESLREQIKLSQNKSAEVIITEEVSFSNQAIKALQMATEKAQKLGYIYVGSEHIFIAVLSKESFGAVKVLKALGVDISRIQDTVTRITAKRSLNRAHPEIQSSRKLTEITKAVQAKLWDIPFTVEDQLVVKMVENIKEDVTSSNNYVIGTDEILSAICKVEDTSIKHILDKEGINAQSINEYTSINTDRSSEYDQVKYQLTPVAHYALEKAHDIATDLGCGTVRPEHIILGLLKEQKGVAIDYLKDSSISIEDLYKKILTPIEQQKPPTLSIIKLAKEEAARYDYNVVGTEHILLGLLCVGVGVALKVLNDLGVTLKDARIEVEKITGYGTAAPANEMTFTEGAKHLLELAWEEAKNQGGQRIESEHLLAAITRLKTSMAMKILTNLGVDAIEVKQGIAKVLENNKNRDEDIS